MGDEMFNFSPTPGFPRVSEEEMALWHKYDNCCCTSLSVEQGWEPARFLSKHYRGDIAISSDLPEICERASDIIF